MISNRVLKCFSDRLQRFPRVFNTAIRVRGFRKFDSSKLRYRKISSAHQEERPLGKSYDLVFDAQCLQTPTRQRGIGKYSLNLISAICKANPGCRYLVVLTSIATTENLNLAKEDLASLGCTNLDVVVVDIFESKKKISFLDARHKILKYLEQHNIFAVLSLSPFEKLESAIPFPVSSKFRNFSILYDLIKLQYSNQLLISRKQKTSYAWSLNNLQKYDGLLSISEETKRHWIALTKSSLIVDVISGGGHPKLSSFQKGFEDRAGVMCIGAEQTHKNIKCLIEAYCLLPIEVQLGHELTVLGVRSIGVRNRFARYARKAKGKVVFPDYLSDTDLYGSYENSRLLVVPSLLEGLSLPILEAWSHGLVAIGSLNTVAQETIENKDLLFDPTNAVSMGDCMQRYLTSESAWNIGLLESKSRSKEFTWEITANLTLNAINKNWDE